MRPTVGRRTRCVHSDGQGEDDAGSASTVSPYVRGGHAWTEQPRSLRRGQWYSLICVKG